MITEEWYKEIYKMQPQKIVSQFSRIVELLEYSFYTHILDRGTNSSNRIII